MPLKVYSTNVGFEEKVVAATSKTQAARAMGMSLYIFNQYVGDTGNQYQIDVAMTEPGMCFVRSNNRIKNMNGAWWRYEGIGVSIPWERGIEPDLVLEEPRDVRVYGGSNDPSL